MLIFHDFTYGLFLSFPHVNIVDTLYVRRDDCSELVILVL